MAKVTIGLAEGALYPDECLCTGPHNNHAFDSWTARAIAVTIVTARWHRGKGLLYCQKG